MIRKATIQDLDQITKIESKCFPESEAASKESLEARILTFSDSFWVLEVDNQIVSFINGMITNEKTINDEMFEDVTLHNPKGDWQAIFGVDTLPEYQGKGYASILMDAVITVSYTHLDVYKRQVNSGDTTSVKTGDATSFVSITGLGASLSALAYLFVSRKKKSKK